MSKVRVPPNPNYVAEVVVLLTSLGAKRSELNAGRRACDALEIKRAHLKVIDFNLDARAGRQNGEEQAIERLEARNEAIRNEDGELPLPQIFVDGNYLGDADVLQGLEDDGLLGSILRRQMCLKCFSRKPSDAMVCPSCGADFEEILPMNMTIEEALLYHYGAGDKDDLDEDSDSGSEAGERLAAYEAALAAPAKGAARQHKPTMSRGRGEAMFQERKRAVTADEDAVALDGGSASTTHSPSTSTGASFGKSAQHAAAASFKSAVGEGHVAASSSRQEKTPKEHTPKEAKPQPAPCEKPPELQGYLWKKSPNQLRFRSFEKRWFIVRDMQISWWKTERDAATEAAQGRGPLCRGFIDLRAGPVEVSLMLGNETTFFLKPAGGTWAAGAISKGDTSKSFTLDTGDSQHSRDKWIATISQHIKKTEKAVPADASFYTAVGLPAPR